jgi:hypothetical protein
LISRDSIGSKGTITFSDSEGSIGITSGSFFTISSIISAMGGVFFMGIPTGETNPFVDC